MRISIIVGSAITGAVLAMIGAVVGGVVAAGQLSVTGGVLTRGLLVVIALALTAVIWWLRMTPSDRPEALLAGLGGAWLLDISNWTGNGVIGQLFTDLSLGAGMIDLVLWAAVSFGLVLVLSRTSATTPR